MCSKNKNVEKRTFFNAVPAMLLFAQMSAFNYFIPGTCTGNNKENLFNYFVTKMYCGCYYRMKNIS